MLLNFPGDIHGDFGVFVIQFWILFVAVRIRGRRVVSHTTDLVPGRSASCLCTAVHSVYLAPAPGVKRSDRFSIELRPQDMEAVRDLSSDSIGTDWMIVRVFDALLSILTPHVSQEHQRGTRLNR